jgi:hypothetical protein
MSLGSSVVERSPEEAGVVSSILTRGTIRICGYGSVVELLLAMERAGVRFPLAAPKKHPNWVFLC